MDRIVKKILFFDLDDTLYRRSMPFEEACRMFFRNRKEIFTIENDVEDTTENAPWQWISPDLVKQAFAATQIRCEEVYFPTRRGEMTKDEGFIYRFQKGFEDVGIRLSREEALLFRGAYQEAQKQIRPDPVILEALPELAKVYEKIGVITNGTGKHQRMKLDSMDLYQWIDPALVVVSEEAGIDKPAAGIFRYAENLAGAGREDLVYVGDSPEMDVEAAGKAGWNAVLWDWNDTDRSVRAILACASSGP